ncbi:hypothetical protein CH274_10555 [Rhodococcus sp. 06-418-5]|uniref:copper resistance CopC family protein n=1 Tax=Rhodococcus sp. 06-418-5 TaxID=2022507 RepID=UPI000B9A90EB|nr:copper resistance CopC family protein [Rhodococcus sp. 06-418-5]OZC81272.1 hypothetical protein CH274_10555 [Rhodococcus sp. 06-418-5]
MKRLAVIAAAILTATALSIAPAAAHATLQSSNPAENSVLDAAPDEVTLTFNQSVQSNFATVTVVGADGTQWGASDPLVDGSTVTVDLDGLGAAGEYTIGYRVVSADGHPITGSIPFQLTQASSTSAATAATAVPAPTETTPTAAEEPEDSSGFPIWIVAVVVVAIGAAGVLFALRKRSN